MNQIRMVISILLTFLIVTFAVETVKWQENGNFYSSVDIHCGGIHSILPVTKVG